MFQTFLFCCILAAFAITSTEAALSAGTITFSDRAVGAETSVTISFSVTADITEDGTGSDPAESVDITFPGNFEFASPPTVEIVKSCGTHNFGALTVVGQIVTLPFVVAGSTKIDANRECIFRIKGITNPPAAVTANNAGYKIEVKASANAVADATWISLGGTVQSIGGAPTVYSVKKTCSTGGDAAIGTVTTNTDDALDGCVSLSSICYDCSLNGYGFYTEYVTSCTADETIRCDARMYSKSTLDIYFNTGGIEGTTTCAAFTKGTTVTSIYSFATDSNAALISKSSAVITSKSANADNVISLTSLKPKTPYDVYCQTNDNAKSTVVTMWTAPYPVITGYSYLRSTTSPAVVTGTAILTFTHGHELASGDTIVVSLFDKSSLNTAKTYYDDSTPGCTATSGGSSLTLTSQAASGTNGDGGVLTITLGATSAAGNEIVVTCTTGLVNPANGISTVYNLDVAGHNLIKTATGQSFAV